LNNIGLFDRLLVLGFGAGKHFFEQNGLAEFFRRAIGCMLDRGSNEVPPFLEPCFRWPPAFQLRVAQQNGVECSQDLAAMILRPSDGVLVLELAVFWV
jgi:hypothetical protein